MKTRTHGSRVIFLWGAVLCATLLSGIVISQTKKSEAQTAVPAKAQTLAQLDAQFSSTIRPFLETNCIDCHGNNKPEADFDISAYTSAATVVKDTRHSLRLLERLKSQEMPPQDAKTHPTPAARQQVITWLQSLRDYEMQHNAGDPGEVLARRLSNSEFNYTIRDLTGVDLQPTKEFPIDPSNTAGFDNSGESLVMSPELLKKYLQAAHSVADHMFLTPTGFDFYKTVMLSETDRDQYCVQQILAIYHRQNLDYADYFQSAWQFKNRVALKKPQATLPQIAADNKVSAKYLAAVWSLLEETKDAVGPLGKLIGMWQQLPAGADKARDARQGCEDMRAYVTQARAKVETRFLNVGGGRGGGGTAVLIWKDVQYATHRMTFDANQLQVEGEPPATPLDVANEPNSTGEFGPGHTIPVINVPGDPDVSVPAGQRAKYEASFAKFCSIFPDKFYMEERGRNYFDITKDRGRFLSAGFHSNMGYFRDDQPLSTLILDQPQQKELDDLWFEFDYLASATARMYIEGSGGGQNRQTAAAAANPNADPNADPAPTPAAAGAAEDDLDLIQESRIKQAEARAVNGAQGESLNAAKYYYEWVNNTMRSVEKARADSVPLHNEALLKFAARAYRRPLSADERDDLLGYCKSIREKDGLNEEAAMREAVTLVLMSPDMGYRIDLLPAEAKNTQPLSDFELASRLSYFLWSSMPDEELLAHARTGDLHDPKVMAAQARRMLKDPRVRALAVEFGGNWLDFRSVADLNTVDRERFPSFSNDLRSAMFEEPVRFLSDVFQNNRSILDLLFAKDTYVNAALATHYGMPATGAKADEWIHVTDADKYDRGGILPMAAFLTKNAPGLRTSPVKRGNWVVRNVLGERIPPPPPVVPELPHDETKLDLPLRDVLARHRADPSCAACHARFDALGLVFEGFGPIGERRDKDLAGHVVDASASFPSNGGDGTGVAGLRTYIRDHRQNDFIDNMSGKLVAFALNRSLILSDDTLIQEMHKKLATDGFRFDNMVDTIVTSPQFLNKKGRED